MIQSTMMETYEFRHPSVILITGGRDAGKTSLGHKIIEDFHKRGVKTSYLCPFSVYNAKVTPKWLRLVDYRYPKIHADHVVLYDDAQIQQHAREWHQKKNITFDKIITLSRHRKSTIILTTQETYRLDRNITGSIDYWILRKPSLMSSQFERREIRPVVKSVSQAYRNLAKEGFNYKEYYYLVCDSYIGWVGPVGEAAYFNEKLSNW